MKCKTVIVDRKIFDEAIQAFCRRNGVSMSKVSSSHGFTNTFIPNGRKTFQKKHPESKRDYIEISEKGYMDVCTAFLLTPERYIVTDLDDDNDAVEAPVEPKPTDKTVIAYMRMLNERLQDIEKIQKDQTALLERLLEVWEKS